MFPQIYPDFLKRLGHMIAHRMFGDPQAFGYLGVGKTFLPHQLVHLSALGRQAVNGLFEQGFHFPEIQVRFRMVHIGRKPSRRIVLQLDIACVPFDIVEGSVRCHLIQVGRRLVDRSQLLPALPKPQENILNDLFGPIVRLQQLSNKGRQTGGISKENSRKRGFITFRNALK